MAAPVSYKTVPLSELMEWVEKRLDEKYQYALEGTAKRFVSLFSIFRIILSCCLELSDQFQRSSSDNTNTRPLIDNIM